MRHISSRLLAGLCTLALTFTLLPAAWAADAEPLTPMESVNYGGTYNGNWAVPIDSYLYQDGENLVRVEYTTGIPMYNSSGQVDYWILPPQLRVETYDSGFHMLSARQLDMELEKWGGFYAGQDYNFLIFGQENPSESDSTEVLRVVKYDKQWNRLGQASLWGANTKSIFEGGSLRCDEYNGYLYIRTCHTMYYSSGANHQANMMLSVRQSDMAITDFFDDICVNAGEYSHSFNQFILVDSQGRLVALDHGDALPRGAILTRYGEQAGHDTFLGGSTNRVVFPKDTCTSFLITAWPGPSSNTTGAHVTDLAETSTGYLAAYSDSRLGASASTQSVENIYLSYTSKDNFSADGTTVRQLTFDQEGAAYAPSQPLLVPTGPDGGYIMWPLAKLNDNGYYYLDSSMAYATYSADGTVSQIQTVHDVWMSRCHPIVYNGKVVWYYANWDTPVFYTLDQSGITATPATVFGQPDPSQESAPSFTDVPQGAWYAQYVEQAAQAGLMEGTGDGRFSPDTTLSLAQVVALTARLHAQYYGNTVPEADGAWYEGAYLYGLDKGLFTKMQVRRSLIEQPASRYQMVTLLDRAVPSGKKQPIHTDVTVPDVSPTGPYGEEVYRWYEAGILEGDSQGRFNGSTDITRAEMAAILCRLAGLTPRT